MDAFTQLLTGSATMLADVEVPPLFGQHLVKLLLAVVVGGAIGAEREFRDKAAGFRTIIFICVGSTLLTIFSISMADGPSADPTRIASSIATGVGFLGAGTILRDRGRVLGLTTAATVWLAAAMGMGIGAGEYAFVIVATAVVLFVLVVFPYFERYIDDVQQVRTYEIACDLDLAKYKDMEVLFRNSGLKIRSHKHIKRDAGMIIVWDASGTPQAHEDIMAKLFDDPRIKEFSF